MSAYPANISIKARYFKSFGEEPVGLENVYPINLIIGRNNSGKSALLDTIRYLTNQSGFDIEYWHKGKQPEFIYSKYLTESEIEQVFSRGTTGGSLSVNHFRYGQRWIDKPVTIALNPKERKFISIEPSFESEQIKNEFSNRLAKVVVNPLQGKAYHKIAAERDIRPESDGSFNGITEKGDGVTNIIQQFLNKSDRDRSVVEVDLLKALNEIFNPDCTFDRISVRQRTQGALEIYLDEKTKGPVPLSQSGSGIKTVILVLVHLLLLPKNNGKELSDFVFAFEELENNLHPGLQRRLLNYIRAIALKKNCCFFLTTHSNVVIDLFSRDESAQIIHVTHNGDYSTARRVQTYIHNRDILDDLDVRASDLLQSNAIIWVEGPSDRLYMNRWIELFTDGQLREGAHYQCVFYGGRLLSHLSAPIEQAEEDHEVNMLRVNGHAVLLMDSDITSAGGTINSTKQRLKHEIESAGGHSWVTDGREVENYIPLAAVQSLYGTERIARSVGKYNDFSRYLDGIAGGEGERFERNKVAFADKVCPLLTKDIMLSIRDWQERMKEVCSKIAKWNNLSQSW